MVINQLKTKKGHCLVLLILAMACSCNGISEKSIIGKWNFEKYQDSESQGMIDFGNKLAGFDFFSSLQKSLYPYDYIEFHKNHQFNEVLLTRAGNYISGQWELNKKDSIIILHYIGTNKKAQAWKIKVMKADKEGLVLRDNPTTIKFYSKDALFSEDDSDSYTTPELNEWRNRPLKPETEIEITKRAKASIAFEIAYLKRELKLKDNPRLIKPVILPLRLDDAEIKLLDFEHTPTSWKETFYDSTQAKQGYWDIRRIFFKTSQFWPQLQDHLYGDMYLLREVYDSIK